MRRDIYDNSLVIAIGVDILYVDFAGVFQFSSRENIIREGGPRELV
jgi:hypothetical protein